MSLEILQPPSTTGSSTADTTTISSATSGTLTLSQTTYTNTYLYFTGTLSSTAQRTLIMKFNSDTTSGHYTLTTLQECDNTGSVSLSFSSGLPLTFSGGAGSGSASSTPVAYMVELVVSAGTTTWQIFGQYTTGSNGIGHIYGTGTFNAAVTSITVTSNSAYSATLSGIKAN